MDSKYFLNQVTLVESVEQAGNFILLLNTHLYYKSNADFIRLVQAIVSIKYIESIIYDLVNRDGKKVSIIFGGDFNSSPNSIAIEYILTGSIPFKRLKEGTYKISKQQIFKILFFIYRGNIFFQKTKIQFVSFV